MTTPLLTVGITTYERPGALRRAVASILDQTDVAPGDVELIVVDDASPSEASIEYLAELEQPRQSQSIPVRVIRHAHGTGGPSTGRNDVIAAAKGDYVLFLDDDNSVLPGALSLLVDHLRTTSADWVSLRRHRNGRSFFRSPEKAHRDLSRTAALWTFLIGGAFRRDSIVEFGMRFDPAIRYGEDNEFVLEFVTKASRFDALSDRDYLLEGDPLAGELPHISHLRPGADFVEILIRHVDRLFTIISTSDLEPDEKEALATLVLNRSTGSYNLHRKIADLPDIDAARSFLIRWGESIARALPAKTAIDISSKRGLETVAPYIFSADIEEFRRSVREL